MNDNLNDNQNKLGKIEYIQQNIKSGWGQFKGLFRKPKTVDLEKDQEEFKAQPSPQQQEQQQQQQKLT